jgi:hypothetical protein
VVRDGNGRIIAEGHPFDRGDAAVVVLLAASAGCVRGRRRGARDGGVEVSQVRLGGIVRPDSRVTAERTPLERRTAIRSPLRAQDQPVLLAP